MKAAITNAVMTSNTECCFKNTVDIIIRELITVAPIRILKLFVNCGDFHTASQTPIELYTWMLGNRLVGVSILYKERTILIKILLSVKMTGLK